MAVLFENDWADILKEEFEKDYYKTLRRTLAEEYKTHQVFPDMYDIFNAFHLTSYEDTKIVILGQDPYHDDMQAHGLSFSVMKGIAVPPSLRNIYKELNSDIGCSIPEHGCLTKWAEEGVLLLNSVLTVRAHSAASHKNLGWEKFTDSVISSLNEREKPMVFILWGAFAQSKEHLISSSRHLVIKSAHPSPLSASRGFFGSRPFSRANDFLIRNGQSPVDWQIE